MELSRTTVGITPKYTRKVLATLIQRGEDGSGVFSSQVYEIKAKCERDSRSVRQYVTVASERFNAEFVKLAQKKALGYMTK